MYFLVIIETPSNECGHSIGEFDTLEEAQQSMKEGRKEFPLGVYSDQADVKLCVVLEEEEWNCKGSSDKGIQ